MVLASAAVHDQGAATSSGVWSVSNGEVTVTSGTGPMWVRAYFGADRRTICPSKS